jgi:hypothetical protein
MTDSTHTESTRIVGPRGWAVLVLAGGAALSAPFLRNPGNPPGSAISAGGKPSEVDVKQNSWPDLREKSLAPANQVPSNLNDQDWAELARLQNNSGAVPRKVTGNLPSTSASALPAWAERGPRVDQLVNESIRTPPLAPEAPTGPAGLDPLRPWMGHGMKSNPASTAAPQAADLIGDFALKNSNPDTRWNTVPSTPTNSEILPQNSGALAGNGLIRKFEDHVKQWPDEKLSPSQVAWDAPQAPLPNRNTTSPIPSSSPSWPSVSQPSGFPLAGQNARLWSSQPTSLGDPLTQPDTVSAPMVSSQSGRQPPRLNNPAVDAPKPSAPSPRPKYFIQQPTKRA